MANRNESLRFASRAQTYVHCENEEAQTKMLPGQEADFGIEHRDGKFWQMKI